MAKTKKIIDSNINHEEINNKQRTRISKEPQERKQEIIETALELFSEKGFENTTIQDIAEKMNVSQGLCYRYFKSKTEIFAATSEYYAMKAVEQIQIPISEDLPAIDKLNTIIKRMFEYEMKHHEFEARYNENSEIRASRLDNVAKQLVDVMIPIIEQGVRENVFHCTNVTLDTKFLVFGIIHTFHEEMPNENIKEYIVSFLNFMKDAFICTLKIEDTDKIGEGWINL